MCPSVPGHLNRKPVVPPSALLVPGPPRATSYRPRRELHRKDHSATLGPKTKVIGFYTKPHATFRDRSGSATTPRGSTVKFIVNRRPLLVSCRTAGRRPAPRRHILGRAPRLPTPITMSTRDQGGSAGRVVGPATNGQRRSTLAKTADAARVLGSADPPLIRQRPCLADSLRTAPGESRHDVDVSVHPAPMMPTGAHFPATATEVGLQPGNPGSDQRAPLPLASNLQHRTGVALGSGHLATQPTAIVDSVGRASRDSFHSWVPRTDPSLRATFGSPLHGISR